MPAMTLRDEKRFAVVMYGGVSLAVYMNGVSLELFRLVQSTSVDADTLPVKTSANVYREIAGDLKTRFVVDILSGTSAGGINAVFLAKALANGQDFGELEPVWVNTADLLELINDNDGGVGSSGAPARKKTGTPVSLLDGELMYRELLATLERMEKGKHPPFAEELDLFVTATDLQGMIVPVELSNGPVYERQHRQVFHFRKHPAARPGEMRNDLERANNEFIAFAARSTSSFPFAFAPVQLKSYTTMHPEWRHLCRLYPSDDPANPSDAFGRRSFADGGYLDNKPFTYAIETMVERHADSPVDRMLLYIEPNPEALSDKPEPVEGPPDAVGNVIRAFTLPQYETIQQDILLIRQRNRLIDRVNLILKGTEEDIQHLSKRSQPPRLLPWLTMDMKEMIREQGFAYGGYFRLRVARLTDELAEIIAGQLGVDVNSDEFIAIRGLIRAWRDERYCYYEEARSTKQRFSAFLRDYDMSFAVRRLAFVLSIIDRLLTDTPEAKDILTSRLLDDDLYSNDEFRKSLMDLRGRLSKCRKEILARKEGLKIPSPLGSSAIGKRVENLIIDPKSLAKTLVRPHDEHERARNALAGVRDRSEAFDEFFSALKSETGQAELSMDGCKELLGLLKNGREKEWDAKRPVGPADSAAWIVKFYFRFFPHYDSVSLPILQTPDLGEEISEIKVIRISPESTESLGGLKFGNFGAFFDRTWRKNDLLRGRLDGARGIITALYPGEDPVQVQRRAEFIHRAHLAIIDEWLQKAPDRMDLLAQVMVGATEEERKTVSDAIGVALKTGKPTRASTLVLRALHGQLTPDEFLKHFEAFTVDTAPGAETLARAVSRMVAVAGRMLTGIASGRDSDKALKVSRMFAQIGALAAGLVDVIIPGTWRHLLFRRALYLVMVFGIVMMIGQAFLTHTAGLQQLGAALFGCSLLLELLRRIVSRLLHREKITVLVIVVLGLGLGALIMVGLLYLPQAVADFRTWIRALI